MKILLALISLMTVIPATAAEFAYPIADNRFVSVDKLQADLRAGGFSVSGVSCAGRKCTVTASDAKMANRSGSKAKFAAITAAAAEPYESAKALSVKLEAGTATPAEKDRLLLLLARLLLADG